MKAFPQFVIAFLLFCLAPGSMWAQQLQCNPCSHAFGQVQVGKSVSYTIQLSNIGTKTLSISSKSVTGSEFSFVAFPVPVNIQPGTSIQLPIIFTPNVTGWTRSYITLVSNDPKSPLKMNVTGTGINPVTAQLAVTPATLSFGSVTVGSSASLQATLTASNAAVTISSDQSTNSQFAIVGLSLPVTIAAGQSVAVTVRFTPSASGAASSQAGFTSNATGSPTMEQLTGTGVAPVNPQLAVSPATLSFGSVTVGSSASLQATLTASNTAVTISSDQSTNSQFAILGLTLPVTIAAGQSVAVTVRFTPSASGTATGQAGFTSNAANSPTAESLTGTGVAPVNPQLAVSPATLSFGSVTVGSSASLQATLTASNAAVTISSDQSTNSEFAILGLTLPATIPAGQSVAVTIQFTPSASGAATGQAGFTSNATGSPTMEQLTGTGVAQIAHNVTLSWNPGDGNAVGYNVYRGTVSGGPYQMINTALNASTNYTDFAVVNGTTYYYVATEVNAEGQESAFSNIGQAVIPGVAQVAHNVTLTWNSGDGNAVGYNVYRGTVSGGPYQMINTALDASTSYTDLAVVNGTTYYYVATGVNAKGQESAYSNIGQAVIPTS